MEKPYIDRDEGMREIFRAFAALGADADPAGAEAQALVARWHRFIEEHFYACPKPVLLGISRIYTDDERFREALEEYGTGAAQLIGDAIAVYCK